MLLASVEQSKIIDHKAGKYYRISSEILMEVAGALSAREICISFYPELRNGTISIICGPGNNGADGLVLARHLYSAGFTNLKIFIFSQQKASTLFSLQLKRLKKQDQDIAIFLLKEKTFKNFNLIKNSSLIIDAIFGIGLSREVKGIYAKIIKQINLFNIPIVSLDVPSGLNSDKGIKWGVSVKADTTFTFGFAKPGFFFSEGPGLVGKLKILPIGFPLELVKKEASFYYAFEENDVFSLFPKRSDTANKTNFGHTLIYAGSKGKWGAAILTASAASRVGSGYVSISSFENPSLAIKDNPEFLTFNIDDEEALNKKNTVICIGPGLGVNKNTAELIKKIKNKKIKKVVLDADAVRVLKDYNIKSLPDTWVITPHAGELAYLLNTSAAKIEADRLFYVQKARKSLGAMILLKGFHSILATKQKVIVILSGNAALAKAGTGDILTGMIGGLMAQGLSSEDSAKLASYLHGRIADEWLRSGKAQNSFTANDLRDHLPIIMNKLAKLNKNNLCYNNFF